MLIYSFDGGTRNLGVCIIEHKYDKNELSIIINKIKKKYVEWQKQTKEVIRMDIKKILDEINLFIDQIIKIKYIDRVDLVKKTHAEHGLVTKNLKYFLNLLDANFGKPDTVLIEEQFLASSQSCIVSIQIEYHYADYQTVTESDIKTTYLHAYAPHAYAPHAYAPHAYAPHAYAPHAYAPHAYTPPMPHTCAIYFVGGSLKNMFNYDPNNTYAICLINSKDKYGANKKHSKNNFLYLMAKDQPNIKFKGKIYDVADAYLMARNWIVTTLCT